MPYDIYGNVLRDGDCEVHIGEHHRYGSESCYFESIADEPPTVEEECAARGHVYAGDEDGRGRCYCWRRDYPEPRDYPDSARGEKK